MALYILKAWVALKPLTCGSPLTMFRDGISDHVPIGIQTRQSVTIPRDCLPIPPFLTRHPSYRRFLKERLQDHGCLQGNALQQHNTMKGLIRLAANDTRDLICETEEEKHRDFQLLLVSSISRAVCRNDLRLATKLVKVSALAREHILFVDSNVSLMCPTTFEELSTSVVNASLEQRGNDLRARSSKTGRAGFQTRCALKQQRRRAKLWAPFGRSISLAGVISSKGRVVEEREAMEEVLVNEWRDTFALKGSDQHMIDSIIAKWGHGLNLADVKMPSYHQISRMVDKLLDSAPGPDGIPYSGWNVDACVRILCSLFDWLASGGGADREFIASLLIFLPKKLLPSDIDSVIRPTDATRPISLKNSSNKIISLILNLAVKWILKERLHYSQRGFVSMRHFTDNIIDLDTRGRVLSRIPPRCFQLVTYVNGKRTRIVSKDAPMDENCIRVEDIKDKNIVDQIELWNGHESLNISHLPVLNSLGLLGCVPLCGTPLDVGRPQRGESSEWHAERH